MGELRGRQLQPRDIAELAYNAGWTDAKDLVVAVAVCLSESQGYDRAINDNVRDGVIVSRDVGLWQISIDADAVGTSAEARLYDVEANARVAFDLWERRGFQPWVAYNTRICFRDSYLGRACMGVGNYLGDHLLKVPVPDKADGTPYVHSFTTPVLNFQHRLVGCLTHSDRASSLLGWRAATAATVGAVQAELAKARRAAKAARP